MSVRGYAAWLAATAVVLVGCSDEGDSEGADPSPGPSSSTASDGGPASGSPRADPTPAPTLPAEAQVDSEVGAEAFARHYVDLMNHAQATGDAEALMAVSSEQCGGCQGLQTAAEESYADGGYLEGGEFVLRELTPLPADYGAAYGFYAVFDVPAQVAYPPGGGAPTTAEPFEYRIGLYPDWSDDHWQMLWIAAPRPS